MNQPRNARQQSATARPHGHVVNSNLLVLEMQDATRGKTCGVGGELLRRFLTRSNFRRMRQTSGRLEGCIMPFLVDIFKTSFPQTSGLLAELEQLRADKAALINEVAERDDQLRDRDNTILELRHRLMLWEVAK
jgi:hypothetical protein